MIIGSNTSCQGIRGGYRDTGLSYGIGDALYGRKADPYPGKRTRACRYSHGIEISGLQNPETESGKLAFKWSSMAIQDTLFNFQQNFDPIIKDLYRLMKPGSTLVVVGCYNPFKDWTIPDGSMIYAGQLLNFMYNNMNNAMRSHANDGVHDYVFVDVPDTEVISDSVNDMLSGVPALQKGGWDPHPTEAGHRYIANQILTALGA